MKKIFMISVVFVFGFFMLGSAMAQTIGGDIMLPDTLTPGITEGTGTHFEVTDSEYLNVVLESSETIRTSAALPSYFFI